MAVFYAAVLLSLKPDKPPPQFNAIAKALKRRSKPSIYTEQLPKISFEEFMVGLQLDPKKQLSKANSGQINVDAQRQSRSEFMEVKAVHSAKMVAKRQEAAEKKKKREEMAAIKEKERQQKREERERKKIELEAIREEKRVERERKRKEKESGAKNRSNLGKRTQEEVENENSNPDACLVCGLTDDDVDDAWAACDNCHNWVMRECDPTNIKRNMEGKEYLCLICKPKRRRRE